MALTNAVIRLVHVVSVAMPGTVGGSNTRRRDSTILACPCIGSPLSIAFADATVCAVLVFCGAMS
jgi:hypothetical protein